MKKALMLFVSFIVATLTGCSTLQGGLVTPTMSDKDFVAATTDARNAYLETIQKEDSILTLKKDMEYLAGRPVFYGDKQTGFTIQWNKKLSLVSVYPGHITSQLGMESAGALLFKADARGNIHYQNQGGVEKPTTLLANVATQEGLGRLLVKGGFQVTSAGFNGVLAAKINADGVCTDNCGNISIVGGNSFAESNSNAQTQANTLLELGCSNCR
jgi:hypothetical protein